MSFDAMDWAWRQNHLDPSARLVLLGLAHRLNRHTTRCDPSVATQATDCNLSVRTVREKLRDLEHSGLISSRQIWTAPGVCASSEYTLHLDRGTPKGRAAPHAESPPPAANPAGGVRQTLPGGTAENAGGVRQDLPGGTANDRTPPRQNLPGNKGVQQGELLAQLPSASADASARQRQQRELCDAAVVSWNAICVPALARVDKLTDRRRRALSARLRDDFQSDLARWEAYLRELVSDPFRRGEEGTTGWRAGFDWAVKPDSVAKVREDYHRRNPRPAARPADDDRGAAWMTRPDAFKRSPG